MSWSAVSPATRVAVICIILGSVISVSLVSQRSLNGETILCSSFNITALIFGLIGVYFALIGILVTFTDAEHKNLNLVFCTIAVILGTYYVMKGLGYVASLC